MRSIITLLIICFGLATVHAQSIDSLFALLEKQKTLDVEDANELIRLLEEEEYADSLKVFIHADFEKRAERIVKVYGETDVPSEKRLKDKDKRRAAYYQFYTDRKWGDAAHYDVCLDSGTLGIDKCVDIISQLY